MLNRSGVEHLEELGNVLLPPRAILIPLSNPDGGIPQ